MDAWNSILLAIGGNAAVLAILGVLAKSLLEKVLTRDSLDFEYQLKNKADAEIQRIKDEASTALESYKIKLKKSEIFFLRELDAASACTSLVHSILPGINHPDMSWDEACNNMALSFGAISARLDNFMSLHGAMLNKEERELLMSAKTDADYGNFEVVGGESSPEAQRIADEMYKKLETLEDKLLTRVRGQSSL